MEPEKVTKETDVVRKRRFWWLLCCSLVVTAYGAYNLTGRKRLEVQKCGTEAFEASEPLRKAFRRLEFVQVLAFLCEIRIASPFHLRKAVLSVVVHEFGHRRMPWTLAQEADFQDDLQAHAPKTGHRTAWMAHG